jgi:hypothetical protein
LRPAGPAPHARLPEFLKGRTRRYAVGQITGLYAA